jgi:hypothetical protein
MVRAELTFKTFFRRLTRLCHDTCVVDDQVYAIRRLRYLIRGGFDRLLGHQVKEYNLDRDLWIRILKVLQDPFKFGFGARGENDQRWGLGSD